MTLAEVGQAAGYSRGLAAHRFGSKAGLVQALAGYIGEQFGQQRARGPALQPGLDIDVVAKRASALFDLFRPRIDTMVEDLRLAGRAMGETLLRSMAGEDPRRLQILHQPEVEFR